MNGGTLLFPGQGVQYTGMGKFLYESFSGVRRIFEQASDYSGLDIAQLVFEGSKEELSQTGYTQPAVLTVGYAAARILMEETGYLPEYAAGHSLGEITALTTAGGIAFPEAMRLVRLRGKLMQEAASGDLGAMSAVIGPEPDLVTQVCEKISKDNYVVEVSNYNSPVQTVISGHKAAVAQAEEELAGWGAKTVRLGVSAPFHCSLMGAAAEQFKAALSDLVLHECRFPVLSNVTGAPYIDSRCGQKGRDMLSGQITRPVEWTKCMKFLRLSGTSVFVDAGPGNTIKNLVKANGLGGQVFSLDTAEGFRLALNYFGKTGEPDTNSTEPLFLRRCLGIMISTPNYLTAQSDYQKLVLHPYREVKEIYEKSLREDVSPEEMQFAFDTMCAVLRNKQVPEDEYRVRLEKMAFHKEKCEENF